MAARLDAAGSHRYASRVPLVLGLPRPLIRAGARLLLLALSTVTLHGTHVALRQIVPVVHIERAHHIDAAPETSESGASEVCLACQLARTPCGPVALELSRLAPFDGGRALVHGDWSLTVSLSSTPAPARAPPTHA